MRICVIGCGAVGSLFAAHLAKAGEVEIWAYDIWKDHIDAIRKNGLKLSGAADFTARLNADTDLRRGQKVNMVIDTYKMHLFDRQTERALL